ncbi:hypothetical protein B0H11DRAFT_2069101 [Mycena galericulata]|nr:hypothetical protein B0H11DRAFT_2069101 [Mycena galericulata]
MSLPIPPTLLGPLRTHIQVFHYIIIIHDPSNVTLITGPREDLDEYLWLALRGQVSGVFEALDLGIIRNALDVQTYDMIGVSQSGPAVVVRITAGQPYINISTGFLHRDQQFRPSFIDLHAPYIHATMSGIIPLSVLPSAPPKPTKISLTLNCSFPPMFRLLRCYITCGNLTRAFNMTPNDGELGLRGLWTDTLA